MTASTDPLVRRFQSMLEGHYAIERELGRGGMATVYLAQDLRHDRRVAIKLLQPELTTAVTAERFLREIQITAKLQHPHILTLIDSGAQDGLVYYVMPHVEGESLRERLIWEKQLPIEQATHVCRQVASALQYAHERGVIHRDIKPENILLSAGHAMLADFGIARAMRESGQQAITQVGLPLGTPAYMSPEQAAGRSEDIDHRSDIYALGCVLFEMVAGRPPFVAPTVSKVLQMHISAPPPSVCDCRTSAPDELSEVLKRSLAKERGERYQSASEFSNALGLIEAVETLERATPTGARARITPAQVTPPAPEPAPAGGFRRLLIATAGVAVLVLGAIGVRALINRRTPPPNLPPGQLVADGATAAPTQFLASVGVKPLDAVGGDSASRVLSAGIGEEVLTQLSKIKQLRVLSRTTMEAVKAKGWSGKEIADSLGIRFLLEGSAQRSGKDLGVTLRLIDLTSDAQVWGESYHKPLRDILMLRQDIARQVVEALAGQVHGLDVVRGDSGSRNAEAVEARAHGLELFNRGDENLLDEAIRSFQRALEIDPRYAQAAAELSDALRYYVNLGFGTKREPYQTLTEAIRWGGRAVELDPTLAVAWAARGTARMETMVRLDLALEDLDRAVALAPSNGTMRVYRGIVLSRLGRYDDALKEMELAARLDPLNAATRGGGLAMTALGARRYADAAREARLAATRDPSYQGWRVIEGLALMLQGNPKGCVELKLENGAGPVTAICMQAAGDVERARRIIDTLETAATKGKSIGIYTLGFIGTYHALEGQAAAAIDWLGKAYAISPTAFDTRLIDSALFDRVRNDPVFQQGLESIRARIRGRFS